MKDEKLTHLDVHFQEELGSLKANITHMTSLLKQMLKNTPGEGSSNWPATFV